MAIIGGIMNILPKELIDQEIKSICSRYKIGPEPVRKHINETIRHHPRLIQKIQENKNVNISRLKAYKCFIKDVKKTIYYQLRKYHQSPANESHLKQRLANVPVDHKKSDHLRTILTDLLASHVSSKERLPYIEEFYRQLFECINPPQTIVDIGCGLHPLSYPFDNSMALKAYFAIDKDVSAIDVLNLYAPHIRPIRLKPVCMDIKDITWSDFLDQASQFDLAIMLKLIPVICRHSPSSLTQLYHIPAKRIVITGNIESMTRHENIRRKEEQVLHKFIEMTGRKIINSFQIDNEFGLVI
jgi:16S rRNA (guanine(1405)-N(7))-methyltransferase